jgi:hypothetical protein
MFSAIPRASNPVFMFCAPGLIFGDIEGIGSRFHVLRFRTYFRRYRGVGYSFHVLRSHTRFRRYRGHRVPFSYFALTDLFSAVPRVSGLVFFFCTPRLVCSGTKGVPSRFHVFCSRTCFRRYRGRRVPFSCFACPYSFSAVLRVSGPVFMFCAPELISIGTEGDGLIFLFCVRTRFRRYRGRRVLFSCFALLDSFSAVPRASHPVFLFFAPGHVLRQYRFHVLRSRTHFRWYRGRQVLYSYFALPNSFSAVPRASNPVFMFLAPGHVFGRTEGVGSGFFVLCSRTYFRRYRGRRVPFSCYALLDSFSAVPRASSPVFLFCAPEVIFGGTEGIGSRFHVFLSRTHFRRYRGRRALFL